VTDALRVDVCHPLEDFFHILSNLGHWNCFALFLCLLDYFLKVGATEFEYNILHALAVVTLAVVDVEHLDAMLATPETLEHLKFPGHEVSGLGCALDGHPLLAL